MKRTTSAKDVKLSADLEADLDDAEEQAECLQEIIRLRRKERIHSVYDSPHDLLCREKARQDAETVERYAREHGWL